MRSLPRSLALPVMAAALLPLACGDSPAGATDDTRRMAERFDAIADSLDGAGMDAYARPYEYVAHLIRAAGGASPVALDVDGAEQRYYAVGEQLYMWYWRCDYAGGTDTTGGPADSTRTGEDSTVWSGLPQCELVPYVQNTFYAWEPDSSWRLLRIMADTGQSRVRLAWNDSIAAGLDGPIGNADIHGSRAASSYTEDTTVYVEPAYAPILWAELMDSEGRFWWANDGSQTNRLAAEGGVCETPPYDTTMLAIWAPIQCNRATFSYEHRLRFDPPPSWIMSPRAGGEDTVRYAMSSQRVRGVVIRIDTTGWWPPVDTIPTDTIPTDTIPSDTGSTGGGTLDASAFAYPDTSEPGGMLLRLTVVNNSSDTLTIDFASGQEFDFIVLDSSTGAKVWQWSDSMAFTAALQRKRLAPRQYWFYSARWEYGSRTGTYRLDARFTSTNWPRQVWSSFTLP